MQSRHLNTFFSKSVLLSSIFLFFFILQGYSQNRKLIQLSGVIVGGDSLYGVRGAFVYEPKSGRGTTSNEIGFFSLPILTNDTLIIKAIGFKQKRYVVPDVEEKFSVMLELTLDTSYLPAVEVFPWQTEKEFKEAFLALKLDETQYDYASLNLRPGIINKMSNNLPDDGSMNHRYFMNQQIQGRYNVPTFNLIDPFAWNRFIKSLKNKEYKQNQEKERDPEND